MISVEASDSARDDADEPKSADVLGEEIKLDGPPAFDEHMWD